jgi:hypothetical protein
VDAKSIETAVNNTTPADLSDEILLQYQELVDKQAIYEVLMRYCRAVDRCDDELLKTVFHMDGTEEHAGIFSGTTEEFCATAIPTMREFGASTHQITNVLIEIQGDTAYSEAYATVYTGMQDADGPFNWLMGVRYIDQFEKRDGIWKVLHRRCVCDWDFTVPLDKQWCRGSMPEITPLMGQKDDSDLSYRHWSTGRGYPLSRFL